MNECNIDFLERNGIDPDRIRSAKIDSTVYTQKGIDPDRIRSAKIDSTVYTQKGINTIVFDYGFEEDGGTKDVSIADIVGYYSKIDRNQRDSIFDNLDLFFDNNGDPYHQRSVGMLLYTKDNILGRLKSSFEYERIHVCETGEGSYTIYTNGLHRYTLLRILYLSELADAGTNEEKVQKIREKYKIPVSVTKINLEKTYCKYILLQLDQSKQIKYIRAQYIEYKDTGNIELVYCLADEESSKEEVKVVTIEEFIEIVRTAIKREIKKGNIPTDIQTSINRYPSFKKFIEDNFPEIIEFIRLKDEERREQ